MLRVPYHLDEYLPDLDLPLWAGEVISADLPSGEVWARLAALYRLVSDAVSDAAAHGTRPVVVSGDCTTALGTVAGLQRAGIDPGIVWFDAHGDVQTLETTASGYLGGLPLRLLVGYRPELIAAALGLRAVPEPGSCSWVPGISTRLRLPTWPVRSSAEPRSRVWTPLPCQAGPCMYTSTWM
jgi:arginase